MKGIQIPSFFTAFFCRRLAFEIAVKISGNRFKYLGLDPVDAAMRRMGN